MLLHMNIIVNLTTLTVQGSLDSCDQSFSDAPLDGLLKLLTTLTVQGSIGFCSQSLYNALEMDHCSFL